MEKDELLKISELADFYDTTPKALRLYEKKGILIPSKVDAESGYRYYSADQVKKLNVIVELQELGFTLNEIKKILDGGLKSESFMEALNTKKIEWEQKREAIQRKVESIEKIERKISKKIRTEEIAEMTEDERAWFLLNNVCIEELKASKILSDAIWV